MLKRRIDVDFTKKSGKIKPVNGVCTGPFFGENIPDFANEYRELAIPAVRTANSCSGSFVAVDLSEIFPDADLDERFALSYDFSKADRVVLAASEVGSSVFLTLGESSKGYLGSRDRLPLDKERWARICACVIAHYNEGFAAGYKLGIKYVEIWPYPDVSEAISREDYFELYRITAGYLKKRFPRIKVGAYSSGGFRSQNHVDVTDKERKYVDFLEDFLSYIGNSATSAPLDFLSWRCYAETPEELLLHTNYARSFLNHYGFKRAESIISGFNTYASREKNVFCDKSYPAFLASCLITAEKSDASMMFYDSAHPYDLGNALYSLDDRITKRPYAAYYVMRAYGAIAKSKSARVDSSEDYRHEIYTLAAMSAERGFILVATREYDGVLELSFPNSGYRTYSVEGIIGGGERGAGFVNRAENIPTDGTVTLRVGRNEVYFLTLS